MKSRRNIELALLLAVVPAVMLIFALVHGDARETFEFSDLIVPAILLGSYIAAHLAVRYLAPESDPVLLPIVALLTGIGLAFITRLDPELAASQVVWILIGIGDHGRHPCGGALARAARPLQVHPHAGRSRPPAAAGLHRHRGQRRQALAARRRLLLPARRARQDPHRALPRRLPSRNAERCSLSRRRAWPACGFPRHGISGHCSSCGPSHSSYW